MDKRNCQACGTTDPTDFTFNPKRPVNNYCDTCYEWLTELEARINNYVASITERAIDTRTDRCAIKELPDLRAIKELLWSLESRRRNVAYLM